MNKKSCNNMNKLIIKRFLKILSILSLVLTFVGIISIVFLLEIKKFAFPFIIEYSWIFLLLLPIPLLSIILGMIYIQKEIECGYSIVTGIVASCIFLLIGSLIFITSFQINYNEILDYESIIQEKIPKNSKFYRVVNDSSKIVTNYIVFTNKEDSQKFLNSIKNNQIWLTKKDLNSYLSTIIPVNLKCSVFNDQCYYSIYFKETGNYNISPEEAGNYHINVMMYDLDTSTLTIQKFMYAYIE